jgi:hypothetical protein
MSSKKKASVRAGGKGPNKPKTEKVRKAASAEIAERIEKLESEAPAVGEAAAPPESGRATKAVRTSRKRGSGVVGERGGAGEGGGGGGLNAAQRVLAEAKEPMRIRDITKAAMDNGWWKPAGKTPWATLAAAIGREIKEKGKQSRFKKTDRGLFIAAQAR